MKALVVEDSAATRAILQRTLREGGFVVVAAGNGSDALLLMAQHDLDLVVMDWNLPGMKGFDLVREIRRQPRYDKIKLVMLTTETNPAERSHALAAGAAECIAKPFTPAVVYDKLRRAGLPVPHAATIACA